MQLDKVAHFDGVATADGIENPAIADTDDKRHSGDIIVLRNVWELLGIDAEEGDGWRGGGGVLGGQGIKDGAHLGAGSSPWCVEVEDDKCRRCERGQVRQEVRLGCDFGERRHGWDVWASRR
jgi:hypothetical protein